MVLAEDAAQPFRSSDRSRGGFWNTVDQPVADGFHHSQAFVGFVSRHTCPLPPPPLSLGRRHLHQSAELLDRLDMIVDPRAAAPRGCSATRLEHPSYPALFCSGDFLISDCLGTPMPPKNVCKIFGSLERRQRCVICEVAFSDSVVFLVVSS
jgi:hypothetical protein